MMTLANLRKRLTRDRKLLIVLSLLLVLPLAALVIVPAEILEPPTPLPEPPDDGGSSGGGTSPPPPAGAISLSKSDYYAADEIVAYVTAIDTTSTVLTLDGSTIYTRSGDYNNAAVTIPKADLQEGTHSLRLYQGSTVLASASFTFTTASGETPSTTATVTITEPLDDSAYVAGDVIFVYYSYSNYAGTPVLKVNGQTLSSYVAGTLLMSASYHAPGLVVPGLNRVSVGLGTVASDSVSFYITAQDAAVAVSITRPSAGALYSSNDPPAAIILEWTATATVYSLNKVYVTITQASTELLHHLLTTGESRYSWPVPDSLQDWEGTIDIEVSVFDSRGYSGSDQISIVFKKQRQLLAPGFEAITVIAVILALAVWKSAWGRKTREWD